MSSRALHPVVGLAPTFAWRLVAAARLRRAAARRSFATTLLSFARNWNGGSA